MDFFTLIFTLAPIVADSESSGAEIAPFLLFLSGFIFYGVMYARYRNADKRHSHEAETSAETANLLSTDTFSVSRKGLTNASMKGTNHTRVDGALNQSQTKTDKLIKQLTPK